MGSIPGIFKGFLISGNSYGFSGFIIFFSLDLVEVISDKIKVRSTLLSFLTNSMF